MTVTLKEVFDKEFVKVKFDGKLAKEIYKFQVWYATANSEHIEFFGGNLLGVQVVRFKDSDLNKFFNEVLDVDYVNLSKELKNVTAIDQTYKISSDVYNLTCMYLLHRFYTSNLLDTKTQHRAAYDVAVLFFYRCLAALISYNFKYPADPKIAQKTYSNLSQKFLIKKLGSWFKVVDYRANELIGKESIHIKNLSKFNDDYATVYAINDSQGRIRDLIKNYYGEFAKVLSQGESIGTTSGTYLDGEGEETFKEKTKSVESYVNFIRHNVIDQRSFVTDSMISVITNINKNTSFRMVKSTLLWMSEEYNSKHHDTIDEFLSSTVIYCFYLIQSNGLEKYSKDYSRLLIEIKNLILSTRSTDDDLTKIRDLGEKIITASSHTKISESLMLATRTSLILYVFLKAISSH